MAARLTFILVQKLGNVPERHPDSNATIFNCSNSSYSEYAFTISSADYTALKQAGIQVGGGSEPASIEERRVRSASRGSQVRISHQQAVGSGQQIAGLKSAGQGAHQVGGQGSTGSRQGVHVNRQMFKLPSKGVMSAGRNLKSASKQWG